MSFSPHGQSQDNLKNSVLFKETLTNCDNIDVNETSVEGKLKSHPKPRTEVTNEDTCSRMICNSLQSTVNSDHSSWDLIMAKIDNMIIREIDQINENDIFSQLNYYFKMQ